MHDLFRQEVINNRCPRLYGKIIFSASLSSWLVTALALIVFLGLAATFTFGSHVKKRTASGWLLPDKGMIRVSAPVTGIVTELHLKVGQNVKAGDSVATILVDPELVQDDASIDSILHNIQKELEETYIQIDLIEKQYIEKRTSTQKALESFNFEKAIIDNQVVIHQEILDMLEERSERLGASYERGAVSLLEFSEGRQELLSQKQQAIELQQKKLAITRQLKTSTANLLSNQTDKERLLSELRIRVSALTERKASAEKQSRTVLSASVDGKIAALNVTEGQSINSGAIMITILPHGSSLEAEIFIPTKLSGFLKVGQRAEIKMDAYPAQRFGYIFGEVKEVSKSIFSANDLPEWVTNGSSVYRARISLDVQHIAAYGEQFHLQPGMRLSADISERTERLYRLLTNN